MHVHIIQHVEFEGPAHIGRWIDNHGHSRSETHLYRGDELPAAMNLDRLVIMGGPMNIHEHERYPWLAAEKAFIGRVIGAGKTVIGICLGAQLIADVLGARVYAGPEKEIGWFPVTLTGEGRQSGLFDGLPDRFPVFHWHGDTFDLPAGAVRLAESAACANQAFLHDGRVLGLQFHLESTPESVEKITEQCVDEVVGGHPFIQSVADMRNAAAGTFQTINRAMESILDRLP